MSTTKLYVIAQLPPAGSRKNPPISIAVCTFPWSSRFEQWHIQYLWERSRLTTVYPWWPHPVPKNARKLRGEEGVLSGLHGERPGPAVRRWFGPSLFHLGAFWCWKSGVSDFVGCFLIGYGAQTEKTWTKFSTYDKSSLKACHLLRKNKLVLVTMHEINLQRCCFMANCMAQATQSHLLSQPPYHAVFGPMKGALVCGNQLRQLKIHENPL